MKQSLFVIFCGLVMVFVITLAGTAADGAAVYLKSCKSCHGADGKGNVKLAQTMKVEPRRVDLTKTETQNKEEAVLRKLVKEGTGKMKGKGSSLKDEEIAVAVAYLKVLAKSK